MKNETESQKGEGKPMVVTGPSPRSPPIPKYEKKKG
jgi:hypothetical protein